MENSCRAATEDQQSGILVGKGNTETTENQPHPGGELTENQPHPGGEPTQGWEIMKIFDVNKEQWQVQLDWAYLGEGEWVPEDRQLDAQQAGEGQIERVSELEGKWMCQLDPDIKLHMEVMKKGYPNRWGARIPVKSKWNLELMESLLHNYEDKEVVEWLKYGWPTGRLPTLPDPDTTFSNHKGGTDHLEHLTKYAQKELGKQAIMGPYNKIPFTAKVGISPLSTRPKKNSTERRVILDLSFPEGASINDGIQKDYYMGMAAKLTFPKVDDLACRIFQLRGNCCLFKIDLSRYFRQVPLDPGDYSLIGYMIDGKIYFDKVLPMGMRSAPYIAQRITNAIAHIHKEMEFFILNYVDDFVGAETRERIWQAFQFLTKLLRELRVDTSPEKIVEPTTKLEFLGVLFDAEELTMEITPDRLQEIRQELQGWLYKTKATRKEVELLLGKLQFVAKCVKAGRIFLARIIQWLRGMDRSSKYVITLEARRDIAWWARFIQEFNGTAIVWMMKKPHPDQVIATDASKYGFGGIWGQEYFRGKFTSDTRDINIAIQELLAVMVALKIWKQKLKGLYFWVHVDNEAVATILNTGASRDPHLQNILREIAYIAAKYEFVIKAKHISGVSNRIPDWLSRWNTTEAKREFNAFAKDKSLTRIKVSSEILQLTHSW